MGLYDDDVFVVTPRASATPATITYYESEASGQIRDQWQNVLDVWDVRPETPWRRLSIRLTRPRLAAWKPIPQACGARDAQRVARGCDGHAGA